MKLISLIVSHCKILAIGVCFTLCFNNGHAQHVHVTEDYYECVSWCIHSGVKYSSLPRSNHGHEAHCNNREEECKVLCNFSKEEVQIKYKPFEVGLYALIALNAAAIIGAGIVLLKYRKTLRLDMTECERLKRKDLSSRSENEPSDSLKTLNDVRQSVKTFLDKSVQVGSNDTESCDEKYQ